MDNIVYKGVSALTIGEWTRLFRQLEKAGANDGHEAARLIGRLSQKDYCSLMDLGTDWTGVRHICARIDMNAFLTTFELWRKKS